MKSVFAEADLDPRNAFASWVFPESVDWIAVRRRVEEIASLKGLSPIEVNEAMANAGADCDLSELTEFATRYGQSLDWIALGDPRRMLVTQWICRRGNGI